MVTPLTATERVLAREAELAQARAQASPDAPAAPAMWVLGVTLTSSPDYAGSADRKLGLRPVLAGRIGRWTVSSSSARRLSGNELDGGVSTTVLARDRWQLGVGLRLTHGRDSAGQPLLEGLPDIRSSAAMKGSLVYRLTPAWHMTTSLQQDLFRQQGARVTVGLGWSAQWPAPGWVVDASVATTWASAQAMNVYFGVPASQATAARPAWQPGAGLEQWEWGVGVTHALSTHWRVSANVGVGTLLGGAARSPLTLRRSAPVAQVSLAYVGW